LFFVLCNGGLVQFFIVKDYNNTISIKKLLNQHCYKFQFEDYFLNSAFTQIFIFNKQITRNINFSLWIMIMRDIIFCSMHWMRMWNAKKCQNCQKMPNCQMIAKTISGFGNHLAIWHFLAILVFFGSSNLYSYAFRTNVLSNFFSYKD